MPGSELESLIATIFSVLKKVMVPRHNKNFVNRPFMVSSCTKNGSEIL